MTKLFNDHWIKERIRYYCKLKDCSIIFVFPSLEVISHGTRKVDVVVTHYLEVAISIAIIISFSSSDST